ncbi:MAG: bacteriocin [Oscillospiraceae bacterium]|jgi:bacteriocin-like protein|nr:bacteriocin [Oscillospiraceae bacterium]
MTTTMTEMNLLDYGFEELSEDELHKVEGGNIFTEIAQNWTAFSQIVRTTYPGGWGGVFGDARMMYNFYLAPNVPFLPYI